MHLKSILIAFILFLGGFLLGGGISYHCIKKEGLNQTKIDTVRITKTDTIRVEKRTVQTKWVYDTVLLNDTVYIKDEPQHYLDSTSDYRVDINAVKLYDYSLDIYRVDTLYQIKEKVVQIENKRPFRQFLGIGVGVGYGGCVNPSNRTVTMEPYVGIHLTYGWGFTW